MTGLDWTGGRRRSVVRIGRRDAYETVSSSWQHTRGRAQAQAKAADKIPFRLSAHISARTSRIKRSHQAIQDDEIYPFISHPHQKHNIQKTSQSKSTIEMIARLVHYSFDAVLLSTLLAGVKRNTGYTPNTTELPLLNDPTVSSLFNKYLSIGETVLDVSSGYAKNSHYFKKA
ncbi:unnamed protein product [Sympodiomycopsis kandeliae]